MHNGETAQLGTGTDHYSVAEITRSPHRICLGRLPAGINVTPMYLLGRRNQPGVGNLTHRQAHAPLPANRLDIRACHPASKAGDRVHVCWGFHAPSAGFHSGQEPFGVRSGLSQATYGLFI